MVGAASSNKGFEYVRTNELCPRGANTTNRVWLNYRYGQTDAKYGSDMPITYFFGNCNGGTSGTTIQAETFDGKATKVKDSTDGSTLQLSRHANSLDYSSYTLMAVWDGSTLKTCNKNQFATANHTHSNYAANDIITVSSTQPTSNTCKIWVKI